MKTPQQSVYCSRCGDELSANEMLLLDGTICAFCDNMHSEALEIHAHNLKPSKPAARNLPIATKALGNPAIKKASSRLISINRPPIKRAV